jgi:hypothetical protein
MVQSISLSLSSTSIYSTRPYLCTSKCLPNHAASCVGSNHSHSTTIQPKARPSHDIQSCRQVSLAPIVVAVVAAYPCSWQLAHYREFGQPNFSFLATLLWLQLGDIPKHVKICNTVQAEITPPRRSHHPWSFQVLPCRSNP